MSRPAKICAVILVVILLLVAALAVCNRPVRTAYHQWRLKVAVNKINSSARPDPATGFIVAGDADTIRAYDYHLEMLVKLGRYSLVEYEFKSIMSGSPKSKTVWEQINQRKCPPWVDVTGSAEGPDDPYWVMVWCEPKDVSAWNEFLHIVDNSK